MEKRQELGKELITAYTCANTDLKERLDVLWQEARHLQMVVGYVLGDPHYTTVLYDEDIESASPNKSEVKPEHRTESQNLVLWLAKASEEVVKDVRIDLKKLKGLDKLLREIAGQGSNQERQALINLRKYLYTQATLRKRAHLYSQRIGNLQNRLGQEMEHVYPDLQSPTIRRRKEYGLLDTYLKELTRWVHRDLIIFVRDCLDCPYPYNHTPTTIQQWQYHYTSHVSSFRTDQAHKDWQRWVYKDKKETFATSQTDYIQTSYWMLDRASLHPIIGHELAHRVLRDALGKINPLVLSALNTGKMGRLVRRLVDCIEAWTPGNGTQIQLVEEILCDLLASSRFGYAYLYAWFLEILASDYESDEQVKDEFGRYDLEAIDEMAENPHPYRDLPRDYLRGIALLEWLKHMPNCGDSKSLSLRKAIECHLNVWLWTRLDVSGIIPQENRIAEESRIVLGHLTDDLKKAIRKVKAAEEAGQMREGLYFSDKYFLNKLKEGDAPDCITGNKWNAYWLNRQRLGNDVCDALKLRGSGYCATDIPWLTEWEAAEETSESSGMYWNQIAMENYLSHIGHSAKLLGLVNSDDKGKNWKARSLDAKEHCIMEIDASRQSGKAIATIECGTKITKLWHFELLAIAPPSPNGGTLDGHHNIDKQWKPSNKQGSFLSNALLGRYDRYALTEALNWESIIAPYTDGCPRFVPYFTRSRRLLEVEIDKKAEDEEPILIVLVELKSFTFRGLFVQALFDDGEINVSCPQISRAFLSDGWEDLVLFMTPSNTHDLGTLFLAIKNIHDHPMVSRTESLFTQKAIDFMDEDSSDDMKYRMSYHIQVRGEKSRFIKELSKKAKEAGFQLTDGHANEDRQIFVSHTLGRVDYTIYAPRMTKEAHKQFRQLLYRMESIKRVESDLRHIELPGPGLETN